MQHRVKLVIFGLGFVSFAAGTGLAFLHNSRVADYISNDTPKAVADQPGQPAGQQVLQGGGADVAPSGANAADCTIKGKATKAGKKIYYYQGSLFYNKVKNPVCFDDEADAQAAGYQRSAH